MNLELAEKRFLQQRAQARMRKIDFSLTFNDWLSIWIDSGKWDQRGRGKNQYCMSRKNDIGGYELGNVFIQSHSDNVKEAQIGKLNPKKWCGRGFKKSEQTKLKISQSRKGQINNPLGINNKLKEQII